MAVESVCHENFKLHDAYHDINSIFQRGKMVQQNKIDKIHQAQEAIKTMAQKRVHIEKLSLPFGWQQLQFA